MKKIHYIRVNKFQDFLKALFFVSPFIIGLILIYIPTLFESIKYSFSKMDASYNFTFVGLKNFNQAIFVDPNFVRNIIESSGNLIVNTFIIIIYSLFVGVLLNKDIKGKGFYRAILFLPVIISTGIITELKGFDATSMAGSIGGQGQSVLSSGIFSYEEIKNLISSINVNETIASIITYSINNIHTIIISSSVQIVIFLAALQAISNTVYEAAYVEGATAWEVFWKITFPMISPMIIVNVVYTVVDSFTNTVNPVMSKILNLILIKIDYGTAAAMSWIYFILVFIILGAALFIINKFVFYENR